MIKTVSFAPPRAASSRSAGKTSSTPRKTSSRAASGSSSPQIALEFSALEPAPVEATPAKAKAKLTKVVEAKTTEVQAAPAPAKVAAKSAPVKAAEAPSPKVKAAKVAKTEPVPPQAAIAAVAETASTVATAKKQAPKLKGKRVYAPKDLAAQYGEKVVERPVAAPTLENVGPKKRLNKEEREARRQLIKPDEGLLARLARATQITTKKPKGEPRGKGWKFECGRCGATSYFQTPGGVCACGTIAVKELV